MEFKWRIVLSSSRRACKRTPETNYNRMPLIDHFDRDLAPLFYLAKRSHAFFLVCLISNYVQIDYLVSAPATDIAIQLNKASWLYLSSVWSDYERLEPRRNESKLRRLAFANQDGPLDALNLPCLGLELWIDSKLNTWHSFSIQFDLWF